MGVSLRVLIVDDSDDDALLVFREIRKNWKDAVCRRVETAEEMRTALDEGQWDAVISDYSMPQFSGPAALALFKEHGPDIPFIMVSRVIGEEAAVEALRAGAHDFVAKRNLARLSPAIERELREAQVRKERRTAEEELRASEERFRELADLLPETLYEMDESGFLTFMNRTGLQLFGYTAEDLRAGVLAMHLISEEDRPRALNNTRMLAGGRQGHANAYTALRKDKTGFPVLIHSAAIQKEGRAAGMRGVVVDMTKLQRVEKERERLSTAVRQAKDAIVIVDLHGRIEYTNPAFSRTTGYSQEELLGRPLDFVNEEATDPAILRNLHTALAQGRTWEGHLTGTRRDAVLFEEDCTLSPVRDETGRTVNFVAVRRDVTEQLFRQAQKQDALGTMAGGIAHDFNNILVPIIGYTELILNEVDGQLTEEQRTDLKRVIAAGERAKGLIAQIRAFSRESEQTLQPLRVTPLTKETLELMKASLPATIEIRLRLGAEKDKIRADPTRFHQMLINLITNAAAAMGEEPGVLEVALTNIAGDTTPDLPAGERLELTVRDTGCGMSEDLRGRIFEPFFTTRGEEGGTGLGLAVVNAVVKTFGGTVNVESEPGKGTAFHLLFPTTEGEESVPEIVAHPAPKGTERILFVDDEPDIAELGRKALQGFGYKVEAATGSLEALERFRANPDLFDILVTDDMMPKMTGVALAQAVREVRPDLPVILCTGYARRDQERLEAAGVSEVLLKPATSRQFADAVRRTLDQRAKGM